MKIQVIKQAEKRVKDLQKFWESKVSPNAAALRQAADSLLPYQENDGSWQVDERRHHDHRPSQRPQNQHESGNELKPKLPADRGGHQLEEDEP